MDASAYTVTVTHPHGVPHLNIEVPDDMGIDDRFAALLHAAGRRHAILNQDALSRGATTGESLSALLARRRAA